MMFNLLCTGFSLPCAAVLPLLSVVNQEDIIMLVGSSSWPFSPAPVFLFFAC